MMASSSRARARLERVAAHLGPLSTTPTDEPQTQKHRPLADAFAGVDGASAGAATSLAARWDRVWRSGVAPGQKGCFDAGGPSPALLDLLSRKYNPFAGRRVLVAGCGRGWELLPLAAAAGAGGAAEVVGLEASDAAADAAEEHLAASAEAPEEVKRRVRVERGDFFAYGGESNEGRRRLHFGAAFDCTFLCAFPPGPLRLRWAEAYARLLEPGTGELVVLLFPVVEDEQQQQNRRLAPPPWPVSPAETSALLAPWFERLSLEPVPRNLSHPSRADREWLGRWRRRAEKEEEVEG